MPNLSIGSDKEKCSRPEATKRLDDVTRWGEYIWRDNRLRLTDEALRWCYRLQAKSRGWVAFDGTLRMHAVRDAFVSHYGEALNHFDADLLGDLGGGNGGFLAYLFRQAPSRRHPLKHVLLMSFLFENFGDFKECFHHVQMMLNSDGRAACEMLLRNNQAELISLVADWGQSLSTAAPAVGTSVSSAAKFIDKQGNIHRDRRPHILGTEKERMLRQLLVQGFPRKKIAEEVGVRRAFIKDYLAQHPELKALWGAAHKAKEKERHQAQLLSALEAHPGLPLKAIRRLPQNGFQWLYNNDRNWLQETLPAIWKR